MSQAASSLLELFFPANSLSIVSSVHLTPCAYQEAVYENQQLLHGHPDPSRQNASSVSSTGKAQGSGHSPPFSVFWAPASESKFLPERNNHEAHEEIKELNTRTPDLIPYLNIIELFLLQLRSGSCQSITCNRKAGRCACLLRGLCGLHYLGGG